MSHTTTMSYKGFFARIMEAQRLVGEHTFNLPPGDALPVYPSDAFVMYPENWMRGPGVFVVPVRPNKGLWFDWTMNDKWNTAVLPTVKGCNPITGMQTSGFHLERYDDKCPKHGVDFEGDRYCPECKYKWPFGNYVSYPNTLWVDGWLNTKDGTVRQFFFTEEEMRDIATKMIGKENTVPAFGFAFYRPKEPRVVQEVTQRGSSLYLMENLHVYNNSSPYFGHYLYSNSGTGSATYGASTADVKKGFVPTANSCLNISCDCATTALNDDSPTITPTGVDSRGLIGSFGELREEETLTRSVLRAKKVKEVSVGAGAKIAQSLSEDTYPLDSWKEKPDASMVVYFVFQDKLDELLAGGVKDLEGTKEGMLEGMPVG